MELTQSTSEFWSKVFTIFFEILGLTKYHIISLFDHFEIKLNLLWILIAYQWGDQITRFADKNDCWISFNPQKLGELMG